MLSLSSHTSHSLINIFLLNLPLHLLSSSKGLEWEFLYKACKHFLKLTVCVCVCVCVRLCSLCGQLTQPRHQSVVLKHYQWLSLSEWEATREEEAGWWKVKQCARETPSITSFCPNWIASAPSLAACQTSLPIPAREGREGLCVRKPRSSEVHPECSTRKGSLPTLLTGM